MGPILSLPGRAADVEGFWLSVEGRRNLAWRARYRVSHLTALFGRSRFEVHYWWRSRLRCSPKEWLMRERDREAEWMIAARHPITLIAAHLFYRDPCHFANDFKRRHSGRAPLAWRAVVRGGGLRVEGYLIGTRLSV